METVKVVNFVKTSNVTSQGYRLPELDSALHVYNVYYYDDLDLIKSALSCIEEIEISYKRAVKDKDLLLAYIIISYKNWADEYNALPWWKRWRSVNAPNVEDYEPLKDDYKKIQMISNLMCEAYDLKNLIDQVEDHNFKFEDHLHVVTRLNQFRHLGEKWFTW